MEQLLKDVQSRLKMSNEEFNSYKNELNYTTMILEKYGIDFTDDFKLIFYSHMTSLAKRLKEGITLDCREDFLEDEVEKKALIISEEIILPIGKKYKKEINRLEIVLAAIQIQLALEMVS